MANKVHELPDGYQYVVNPGGVYGFTDCFECGNTIDKGEKAYFSGEGDDCPCCSQACAEARREQLAEAAKLGV
jgi:hypothetical protein